MEFANRLVAAATRAANNNVVINVCLLTSFVVLSVRSLHQQKRIEDLETKKESLLKSNKSMKAAMWDWKQQLFSEATTDSALVPLARLKAIYGEAPSPSPSPPPPVNGDAVKEDGKSPASQLLI